MEPKFIGSVGSVRTELAEWDLTNEVWCAPVRSTTEEYRPDGQCLSSEVRFSAGSTSRTVYSYDESGRLTEAQFHADAGVAGRQTYVYDDRGRLLRLTGIAADGAEQVSEERTYEPDGGHAKVVHLPPIKGPMGCCSFIDGIDFITSVEGARTIVVSYGADGLASQSVINGVHGEVLRRIVVTRDDTGRMTKAEVQLGDQPLHPDLPMFGVTLITEEYSYDEQGRRVEMRRRMFGLSEAHEVYRYDERGNRTETSTEETTSEGTLAENGVVEPTGPAKIDRHQVRRAYKYDARGNWVECVTSQRQAENPDFTPGSIERREIVYYD